MLNIDCDLLFLSETWLCSNISDLELGLANCIELRTDRNVSSNLTRGGGILLAIKSNLNCVRVPVNNISGIEQVFVSLKFNGINLLIGCIYILPNTHSDIYYEHCEVVANIVINYSIDNILIIGDFNLPGYTPVDINLINNPSTNIINNSYVNYLGLSQYNNIPNYNNDNILDLIFSDIYLDNIISGCSLTSRLLSSTIKIPLST